MKSEFVRVLGLAGVLVLGATSSEAIAVPAKIYGSFGAHNSNCQCDSPAVVGPIRAPGYLPTAAAWIAASFPAGPGGTLDYFDLAISNAGGGYPGVVVELIQDNGSGVPDTTGVAELETWVVTNVTSSSTKNTKFTSKVHPVLTAGATYWIVVEPIGIDTAVNWWSSPTVSSSVLYSSTGGGTWNGYTGSQAAFDVWVQ